ncbi:hypothetical protein, conserved [Eimeria tenella]|uniref:Uncharacterized protein n=1 Tax=Eimeria tenella TaxID=5802 RepID=U6L4D0_EIMTE|nr:hypothetical protein, conserved [Eimeria tenella]CDJ45001.1 hypothetical protein, conserved [Eimeria tenella]|eukprot:XP_013235748.1 hypothetical protein, conserved [Eimeria tenella]
MTSPYIVSRPIYGCPLSQGLPVAFASLPPPGAPLGAPGAPRGPPGAPLLTGLRSSAGYGGGPPPSLGPALLVPRAAGPPAAAQSSSSSSSSWEQLSSLRGSPGVIMLLLQLLLTSSLFACVGRCDFNFGVYLVGYHVWCMDSCCASRAALRRLLRAARHFAVLLSLASFADILFLFVSFSTWICEQQSPRLCFPEPRDLQVRWAHRAHAFALGLSLLNLVLKVLVIFLSFSWVQQQRRILGLSTSMGTAMSPPQAAPLTMCD